MYSPPSIRPVRPVHRYQLAIFCTARRDRSRHLATPCLYVSWLLVGGGGWAAAAAASCFRLLRLFPSGGCASRDAPRAGRLVELPATITVVVVCPPASRRVLGWETRPACP